MARTDLLAGYMTALEAEIRAVGALAERTPADFDADPRLRTDAALRLGRVLDALRDVATLTVRRSSPRLAPDADSKGLVDALAEGAGRLPTPALHAALPLLTMARHRAAGALDLASLPSDRLAGALASAHRVDRWIRSSVREAPEG